MRRKVDGILDNNSLRHFPFGRRFWEREQSARQPMRLPEEPTCRSRWLKWFACSLGCTSRVEVCAEYSSDADNCCYYPLDRTDLYIPGIDNGFHRAQKPDNQN